MNSTIDLISKLEFKHNLKLDEWEHLIASNDIDLVLYANKLANEIKTRVYGNNVYARALIEITNYCHNDCYYCGLRKSNSDLSRYRLTKAEILNQVKLAYDMGFRTVVLQGGEDSYFSDEVLCEIISSIKSSFQDIAVTLSLGERDYNSYQALKEAGADRYLLRHETYNSNHYSKLHPKTMSRDNRLECLNNLKNLGYQVGTGFMVGSPYQTTADIAKDMDFIARFKPHMVGIGPFIPHSGTPLREYNSGSTNLTIYLISLLRIMNPNLLIPSTTAIASIDETLRFRALQSGANVIMPNFTPSCYRDLYSIYNNKLSVGLESKDGFEKLQTRLESLDLNIPIEKGDYKEDC